MTHFLSLLIHLFLIYPIQVHEQHKKKITYMHNRRIDFLLLISFENINVIDIISLVALHTTHKTLNQAVCERRKEKCSIYLLIQSM